MDFWVIYEQDDDGGWGAYLPDMPGCVAVGPTRAEVSRLIRETITLHVRAMREDGDPMPVPSPEPWAELVDVEAEVEIAGARL